MRVVFKSTKARSFCMVSVAFVLVILLARDLTSHDEGKRSIGTKDVLFSKGNRTVMVISSRKLLQSVDDRDTKRIGTGCSNGDIVINQGQVSPLPSGIPSYLVQITNTCSARDDDHCNIANIRLHCGWFSSARLINPRLFRRVEYDDCLVNDGEPLDPGKTISFQYANTYRYPLSVASVVCLS